jgi:hypothetical protein
VDILAPQLDEHVGAVELIAYRNHGELPLAEIRQRLVDESSATYVSFIDDDDTVPYYFVNEVMSGIADYATDHGVSPDYVGWQMQTYSDGTPLKPTFHSLRYDHWWDDLVGYYRDISHLNPIRRALLTKNGVDFRKTEPPEDVAWADQLRGKVHTEVYIDRVMYHYHSSTSDSTWRPGSVDHTVHVPAPLELPSKFMRYWSEARFSE